MGFFDAKPKREAKLSADRVYRYLFKVWWDDKLPLVCFIMLNPSKADERVDDATVRRCQGFARRWGYGGFCIVNLYAYRATYPADLFKANDPIGEENWRYMTWATLYCAQIVCAWGDHGGVRGLDIARELNAKGVKLFVLGLTKAGNPKHPVRLPYSVERMEWRATSGEG